VKFPLVIFIFVFIFSCSSKHNQNEKTICEKNECSVVTISPRFLLITNKKTENQTYLSGNDSLFENLNDVFKNFDKTKFIPMDFLKTKSSIILKNFDNSLVFATSDNSKTISFKKSYENFSKPVSACLFPDNSAAFLYKKIVLKTDEYPIKYTVSISNQKFENWKTFSLKSKKQRKESALVEMLETPLRIVCGQNKQLYLITNIVFFHKKSSVFVYKLNQKQHVWETVTFISGLEKGKLTAFYNDYQKIFYVFQKNKLYIKEKQCLKKEIKMPINGEALMFKTSDNKTVVDFLFKNDKNETVVRFMKM
jgi:hypothetical protein